MGEVKLIKKKEIKKRNIFMGLLILLIVATISCVFLLPRENFQKGNYRVEVGSKNLKEGSKVYTEAVESVEITSENTNAGSWSVTKSAKWNGLSLAEVNFSLKTKQKNVVSYVDVIMVIDLSGSMRGDKLARVKSDTTGLINSVLSVSGNRFSIITFSTNARPVTLLSSNKTSLINEINALEAGGWTNYYEGLKSTLQVMNGYQKQENRDVVVFFLTDGYPNRGSPNQKAMYRILKEKYPYLNVYGIQYEMGNKIIQQIREVSDVQYIANRVSLKKILNSNIKTTERYETMKIVDYIENDYFYLESVNDITVSEGNVSLEDVNGRQKITWELPAFLTGSDGFMKIKVKLKDEYQTNGGYYPTNEKEEIISKLPKESEKKVESDLTPVLKNLYEVRYDPNPPSGCQIAAISPEEHAVYENVAIRMDELSCPGYTFKGYQLVDDNIKMVNTDTFVMPSKDVELKGVWGQQSITKTMDGSVYIPTQYKVTYNSRYIVFSNNTNQNVVYYDVDSTDILSGTVEEPVNACNTFTGWFIDKNATIPYDINEHINENRIVYAGYSSSTFCFAYEKKASRFVAFSDSDYKLEAWGARGGNYNGTYHGGYGGYSVGTAHFSNREMLYIYVGGAGSRTTEKKEVSIAGGWNGGGAGFGYTDKYVGSGGGATHISTTTGVLKNLTTAKKAGLLIVAGGGGGAGYQHTVKNGVGGAGGGTKGGTGTYNSDGETPTKGAGGSQTAGGNGVNKGAFGLGGSATTNGVGGGGGYYGGGSSQYYSGAGGGSGYLNTSKLTDYHMYCFTGCSGANTTVVTTKGAHLENTPNTGHGYAQITVLD